MKNTLRLTSSESRHSRLWHFLFLLLLGQPQLLQAQALDATFDPGAGANSIIHSVAIQSDDKILIGGDFTTYDGTSRNHIARLNADGSLDTGFDPGAGANNGVRSVALDADGKILIGGFFREYDGTAINRIARLNADGSLDAGFDPGAGANDGIESVAIQADGKILLGGFFREYDGTARIRVARLFPFPLPKLTMGVLPPICQGATSFTIPYTATVGEPDRYSVTGAGVSAEQTGDLDGSSGEITVMIDPATFTGSFSLVLTNTSREISSEPMAGSVTINELPTVNAGADQSVVFGFGSNCTDLTATASGGSGGGYTYTWNPGNLSGQTVNVCPETTMTYEVTVEDGNGCVSAEDEVTVEVQDVRCGNKLNKVEICYYGVTQCVSQKIAKRYLRLGATLGNCGSGAGARIGYEASQTTPLQLSLKAYPNPVHDAVTVEVLSPSAGQGTFEVLDMTGVARQSRIKYLEEGLNEVHFRLGKLPAGLYLIRAVDSSNRQGVVKVIKQ